MTATPPIFTGLHVYSTESEERGEVGYFDGRIVTVHWDSGDIIEYEVEDFMLGGRYDSTYVTKGI